MLNKLLAHRWFGLILVLSIGLFPSFSTAQSSGEGTSRHQHDRAGMPGLQGVDTTRQESGEMMVMFHHFDAIERTVEELPNGIKTFTYSPHPGMVKVIVSHVTGMIARLEEGRDPQVRIQSPTLDILFERRETIETEMEVTDDGIIVTQTSADPEVVAALKTHAGEVTAMAERGMDAVHEMMEERAKK